MPNPSFHEIITEPIPIIEQVPSPVSLKHERAKFIGGMAIFAIGSIALGTALGSAIVAVDRHRYIQEILDNAMPSETEQNQEVNELAFEMLGTELFVDCNTDKIKEHMAASNDDSDTLAFVQIFKINDETYVPPYVTMQGVLCNDLLTFPRMERPDANGEGISDVTYRIRATEFAKAAAILLHEAEHINLIFNEAKATCYAVQKLPEIIEPYFESSEDALKYSEDAALELSFKLEPEYISDECEPGGEYDLGISTVYTTDDLDFGAK